MGIHNRHFEELEGVTHIRNRGFVVGVTLDEPIEAGKIRAWVGSVIVIQGVRYKVKGVETYAVADDWEVTNVGFLV